MRARRVFIWLMLAGLALGAPARALAAHHAQPAAGASTDDDDKDNDDDVDMPGLSIHHHNGDEDVVMPGMTIHTPASARHKSSRHASADAGGDDSSSSGGPHFEIVAIALGLCALLGRRAWRRRRDRPVAALGRRPDRASRPRRGEVPVRAAPASGAADAVLEQLHRLDRRLARLETFVASPDFELQRGFRTLSE